ncbi:uncharacterized protein FA14DRAFT_175736 [Meira miltonrushii]|uniref:MutL C-terminal dimerisation domain-containing protein n=1 Tax=Meira miltonrushii TaxID=1280837 RepID=A0A316V151_9BASI|nr:uncharacterized protein FA14DRAFT_175736 [Meira miltonrushii]PWN31202.1 hypothetical protein FA14DRAFT_175736 [Meira miltonrushii]
MMTTSIEPLDERTSNTLTASVLYPDLASIAQAFVQNAIKNSPKSYIELRISFAPIWQIECREDGKSDRSADDDSIQNLSFLGTLCTDTCGKRRVRKGTSVDRQKSKEGNNSICLRCFFENIPVRRTSLHNRANCMAEVRKVKNTVKALSLLCPHIRIACYIQENFSDQVMRVFNFEANQDFNDRFETLYCTPEKDANLTQINVKTGKYSISGYVDLLGTSNITEQIVLINGALVRDHNRIDSGDSMISGRLHETLKKQMSDKSLEPVYVVVVRFENMQSDTKMFEHMAKSIQKSLTESKYTQKNGINSTATSIDEFQKPGSHALSTRMDYNQTGRIQGEIDRKHLVRSAPTGKRNAIATLGMRKRQALIDESAVSGFDVLHASSGLSLSDLELIGQVDDKFVACINLQTSRIVLIDQHAAHERIRYEKKLGEYISQRLTKSSGDISTIDKKVEHRLMTEVLYEDFKSAKELLQFWGIGMEETDDARTVKLISLPSLCSVEKKDEIRHLLDTLADWLRAVPARRRLDDLKVALSAQTNPAARLMISLRHAPPMIIDKVTTWSCRGAIMFNDPLTSSQCQRLLAELGQCIFPWQCAHGRPTSLIVSQLDRVQIHILNKSPIDWLSINTKSAA